MLSLDADLQAELSRGATRPVWVVEMYPRPVESSTLWTDTNVNRYPIRFSWSDKPFRVAPASRATPISREQTRVANIINAITPLGATLDPVLRSVTQEDISIEIIDDGTLRNILAQPDINNVNGVPNPNVSNYLYGQKVIIKLGVQNISITKFLTIGTFVVSEVTPRPGIIELACKTITALPDTLSVSRNFRTRSPHGQLHEILYNTVGLDNASGTYDESSVDAWYTAQPLNDIDKRHWACKRENSSMDGEWLGTEKAPENESGWELINQLSFILGGFVAERENGKITYVPYVESASTVRDFSVDDIDQFEQAETYGNLQNQALLKISNVVKKTEWDPANSGVSSHSINAGAGLQGYFGGVNGDATYSSEIDESGAYARYPDRPAGLPAPKNRRYVPFSKTIDWASGMSSAAFLRPRLVTFGSMVPTGDTNSNGSAQGPATYNHATKEVTLVSGYLNISNFPPNGSAIATYLASDFVDVTRGPVFRVLSTPGNTAALDDSGNSVTFKEGRIKSINNFGPSSVITLADDFLLEYQDDWGGVTALDWVILEPSYPVPVDVYTNVIGAVLGASRFPDPQLAGSGANNAHFQRYYYVQWAQASGFAGVNTQFAGSPDQQTAGAPYLEVIPATYYGGPANAEFRLPSAPAGAEDLRLLYGHDTSARYAQLQGYERTTRLSVANDVERYAYLKLEYNTTYQNQVEYIKCNAAYPLPPTWNRWVFPGFINSQQAYGVQRTAKSEYEPPGVLDIASRRRSDMWSTSAYRVDCKTCTVGYTLNPTTIVGSATIPVVPAWDALYHPLHPPRVIIPSGRGQFGTAPSVMLRPAALTQVIGGSGTQNSAATHFLGARCTDVTCAENISRRVLNRTAYGMPIVTFTTSLKHADVQLGDFVSITHPLYLRHNKNGSDSGTVFEITKKEINIEADSPRIAWEAAFIRQDASPTYSFNSNAYLDATMGTPSSSAQATSAVYSLAGTIMYDEAGNAFTTLVSFPGIGPIWSGGS